VGDASGIPFANLEEFPSVLHPEGLQFQGVLQDWFVHSLNHTVSDLGMQEIRMSRSTVIWIVQLITASRSPGRYSAIMLGEIVEWNGCRRQSPASIRNGR
jgi:hypothetical protein